ncbi:hypothetical protein BC629DRAFT_1440573 [Irpex lacteus]|nr:hypothetical protein BC629DRAFT_1440573 [Irpex lacteus]
MERRTSRSFSLVVVEFARQATGSSSRDAWVCVGGEEEGVGRRATRTLLSHERTVCKIPPSPAQPPAQHKNATYQRMLKHQAKRKFAWRTVDWSSRKGVFCAGREEERIGLCTSIADDQLLRDDRFCGGGEEEEEVEHRGTSTVSGYEGTTKNLPRTTRQHGLHRRHHRTLPPSQPGATLELRAHATHYNQVKPRRDQFARQTAAWSSRDGKFCVGGQGGGVGCRATATQPSHKGTGSKNSIPSRASPVQKENCERTPPSNHARTRFPKIPVDPAARSRFFEFVPVEVLRLRMDVACHYIKRPVRRPAMCNLVFEGRRRRIGYLDPTPEPAQHRKLNYERTPMLTRAETSFAKIQRTSHGKSFARPTAVSSSRDARFCGGGEEEGVVHKGMGTALSHKRTTGNVKLRQDEFFENPYGPPANKSIFVIRSCSLSHGKRAVPRPAMTDFLSEGGGGGEAQGEGRRARHPATSGWVQVYSYPPPSRASLTQKVQLRAHAQVNSHQDEFVVSPVDRFVEKGRRMRKATYERKPKLNRSKTMFSENPYGVESGDTCLHVYAHGGGVVGVLEGMGPRAHLLD